MPHEPVIDAAEFARAAASLRGSFALTRFARLRDQLAAHDGTLEYALHGVRDAEGRPALRVQLRGALQLVCQRCLGPLEHAVSVEATLVLAASQAEIDAEPLTADAPERVVASKSLAVRELVEDELLLAVPYAPRHARCSLQGASGEGARRSPFAGLGALLGDSKSGRDERGGKH